MVSLGYLLVVAARLLLALTVRNQELSAAALSLQGYLDEQSAVAGS